MGVDCGEEIAKGCVVCFLAGDKSISMIRPRLMYLMKVVDHDVG